MFILIASVILATEAFDVTFPTNIEGGVQIATYAFEQGLAIVGLSLELAWNIADTSMAFMMIPHLIALFLFVKIIVNGNS